MITQPSHPDYGNPYSFQSQIQVQLVLLLASSLSCIEHIAPRISILKKDLLHFFFFHFVFKEWRTHDKGSSCGVRLKFSKYTLPGALLPDWQTAGHPRAGNHTVVNVTCILHVLPQKIKSKKMHRTTFSFWKCAVYNKVAKRAISIKFSIL